MKINPDFKKTALLAVKEAGNVLEKNFGKVAKFSRKKDLSLLTTVDLRADIIITKIIKRNFPSHNIVSEESGGEYGKEFTWLIDPLDGTTNYTLNFPFFSVSLALLYNEKPILGLVFNPISKELYFAERGKGAYLNKKKISVNNNSNLSRATLGFSRGTDLARGTKILSKIAPHIRTFRFWGSSNLDICQVASGKIDGYFTVKSPYDVIAGVLIVKEAGGKATDFKGLEYNRQSQNLLITNGKIHNKLIKLIK